MPMPIYKTCTGEALSLGSVELRLPPTISSFDYLHYVLLDAPTLTLQDLIPRSRIG